MARMPKTARRYVPPHKYTSEELDRCALLDLEADLRCAERDSHKGYAELVRAQIERIKNGERAHLVALNG